MKIEELKSEARALGIPDSVINSCNNVKCLIGLIKYIYLKNNLEQFNNEIDELRVILEREKEIVKKLFIFELNITDTEVGNTLDLLENNINSLDENELDR